MATTTTTSGETIHTVSTDRNASQSGGSVKSGLAEQSPMYSDRSKYVIRRETHPDQGWGFRR